MFVEELELGHLGGERDFLGERGAADGRSAALGEDLGEGDQRDQRVGKLVTEGQPQVAEEFAAVLFEQEIHALDLRRGILPERPDAVDLGHGPGLDAVAIRDARGLGDRLAGVQGLARDGADLDRQFGGGEFGAGDEAGAGQVFGPQGRGVAGVGILGQLRGAFQTALEQAAVEHGAEFVGFAIGGAVGPRAKGHPAEQLAIGMQGDEQAGTPRHELLADRGVEGRILDVAPLADIQSGGMLLQPEGQRVAGLAAKALVIGNEPVALAEKIEDLARLQDVAGGAAEFVEQARAVVEVGEGAFQEVPRFNRLGGRGAGVFAEREGRFAAPGALERRMQLGILVGDLLEEIDAFGEALAAFLVAEKKAGGAGSGAPAQRAGCAAGRRE